MKTYLSTSVKKVTPAKHKTLIDETLDFPQIINSYIHTFIYKIL